MRCPICGCENTLRIEYLYQHSHIHKINKNGKISKKFKHREDGSMDCSFLACENGCELDDRFDWCVDMNNNLIIKEYGE